MLDDAFGAAGGAEVAGGAEAQDRVEDDTEEGEAQRKPVPLPKHFAKSMQTRMPTTTLTSGIIKSTIHHKGRPIIWSRTMAL